MGCGQSNSATSKEESEKNKQITKMLQEHKRSLESEVKLLLLGAGESGKSTIAKQMRIIHLNGFTDEERCQYKSIIFTNVLTSMRALCQATTDLEISVSSKTEEVRDNFLEASEDSFDIEPFIKDVKILWADKGIRNAFQRSAEFQLNDSAAYYFDKIEQLADPKYVPTEQDILRSRAKTTGIIETEFDVDNTRFRMVDVGGQRSERKKWMHCFQDVTSVIFCVALSEYNLKLCEDDTTNRMMESLKLFKEICNNKWFIETAMILFLNKKDLFEEKIKKVDLKVCFPDYTDGKDFDKASCFIRDKFIAQNEHPRKTIYPHITCATDTQNIAHIFNSVKDVILHQALEDTGLGI